MEKRAPILLLAMCFAVFGLVGVAQARAASEAVTEFPVPKGAGAITAGPDGAIWFANGGVLGRLGVDGKVEEHALPGQTGSPQDIVSGPEGDFWITTTAEVDRVSGAGALTRFPMPGKEEVPGRITVGADGNFWFTLWVPKRKIEGVGERLGSAFVVRITPSGAMTRFELPGAVSERNQAPGGITAGPDGNLWFTDPALGRIGKISTAGEITEYDLDVSPGAIATGPDGNLWFTAPGEIGRISPAGEVRMFPRSGGGARIVAGPDGNLWATSTGLSVRRITPTGQVTSFQAAGGADIFDMTAAAGGIWVSTTSSPIKFVLTAPVSRISPGVPGIEVLSTSAVVRGGKVAFELACGGSARSCSGEIGVGDGKEPIAAGSYSVPAEGRAVVSLRLSASARRQLARKRFLRETVYASVQDGVGAWSRVVFQRPHPLRGVPRPGHLQLMPLPSGYNGWGIARGPGGDLWMSGETRDLIRITPAGKLSQVPIPAFERSSGAIVAGPGRSLWFLEEPPMVGGPSPLLGRISPGGQFSEIALPNGLYAGGLVLGADGNLWITRAAGGAGEIDRVTPGGEVTRFRLGTEPGSLTAGPGGAVWFGLEGPAIGRITPAGKVTRFPIPGRGFVAGIAKGPDGNLWFTHWGGRALPSVGRMTPGGKVTEFPLGERGKPGSAIPGQIIPGPDGNLWFTEDLPARIGRITPQGKLTQWRRGGAAAGSITVGPRGTLWLVGGQQEMMAVINPRRSHR